MDTTMKIFEALKAASFALFASYTSIPEGNYNLKMIIDFFNASDERYTTKYIEPGEGFCMDGNFIKIKVDSFECSVPSDSRFFRYFQRFCKINKISTSKVGSYVKETKGEYFVTFEGCKELKGLGKMCSNDEKIAFLNYVCFDLDNKTVWATNGHIAKLVPVKIVGKSDNLPSGIIMNFNKDTFSKYTDGNIKVTFNFDDEKNIIDKSISYNNEHFVTSERCKIGNLLKCGANVKESSLNITQKEWKEIKRVVKLLDKKSKNSIFTLFMEKNSNILNISSINHDDEYTFANVLEFNIPLNCTAKETIYFKTKTETILKLKDIVNINIGDTNSGSVWSSKDAFYVIMPVYAESDFYMNLCKEKVLTAGERVSLSDYINKKRAINNVENNDVKESEIKAQTKENNAVTRDVKANTNNEDKAVTDTPERNDITTSSNGKEKQKQLYTLIVQSEFRTLYNTHFGTFAPVCTFEGIPRPKLQRNNVLRFNSCYNRVAIRYKPFKG